MPSLQIPITGSCRNEDQGVGAKCAHRAGEVQESKHDFVPLNQMTSSLQDQIITSTIIMSKREEEAKKAITTMDDTISKIEKNRAATEKGKISGARPFGNPLIDRKVVCGDNNTDYARIMLLEGDSYGNHCIIYECWR